MTTIAENKELVRRWIQAFNDRDLDAALRLVATDMKNHAAIPEAQGAAGMRTILTKLLQAIPDVRWTCEDLIAEGDRVVCRITVQGTQSGPLAFTRLPLPASGRTCSTEQLHILRIEGGTIAEHWAGRDDIGMLRQLGHLPPFGGEARS